MSAPLVRLFEALDREATTEFVRSQIGALLDFDTTHSTDLAGDLERILDAHHQRALDPGVHPSHLPLGAYRSAQAARALELIGTDLKDPNERVAVHLALKLARAFDLPASSRHEHSIVADPERSPSRRTGSRYRPV